LGWTEILAPFYVGPESSMYDCPAFPEGYRINYFITGRWSHATGRNTMKLSEIRRTSEFVLSGDCTHPKLYRVPFGWAIATTDDCDKDDASQEALLFAGRDGGLNVHRAGNNVLFADGHVATFRRFDPAAMTYHPTEMKRWSEVMDDSDDEEWIVIE
jgi:prepilin-type processing-associated H-X9-DG protein